MTTFSQIMFSSVLDQNNRDQILDHDGHIFVLAGAGTGKSTIIAQKIIRLLKNQTIKSIGEIAAITYTNKAAAELKWKIEDNLKKEINNLNSEIEINIFNKALKEINEASIGTIHSFCAEILRTYGYLLGLDPAFTILSKNEKSFVMNEVFISYIRELIELAPENHISDLWNQILKYSNKSDLKYFLEILESGEDIYSYLENIDSGNFFIKSESDLIKTVEYLFKSYTDKFLHLLDYYDFEKEIEKKSSSSLGGRLLNLRNLLKSDIPVSEIIERIRIFSDDILPGKYGGSKDFYNPGSPHEKINNILKLFMKLIVSFGGKKFKDLDKDLKKNKDYDFFYIESYEEYYGLTLDSCKAEYLRFLWYSVFVGFAKYYYQKKINQSLMTYSDIINLTHNLVQHKEVIEKLSKKYQYLFVDEYQDTDPVQTEIFTIIAGIYNKKSSSARLVRVGDAKQSIYSFRGADLDTFYFEKDRFGEVHNGLTGSLYVNMRSHSLIINFVNHLFTAHDAKTGGPSEIDIPEYEPLKAGKSDFNMENPGVYLAYFKDSEKNIYEQRKSEAEWISREIHILRKENPELSICIFFRSMTDNIQPYVTALKKSNIPFSLVGRRFYGENFTRKYLTLFLNILYDPFDKISLTGFLRSPVGGFKDIEVEEIILEDAIGFNKDFFLNPEFTNNRISKKIISIIDLLNKCFDLAHNHSISYMIKYVFEHSMFLPFTGMLNNSDVIFESIDRIMELACETDKLKFPSFTKKFRFFIDEVSKLESIPEVDESGESLNGHETVQIMSFHKSKGLEFDVVFLPDLMHRLNSQSSELFSGVSSTGIYWQYKGDFSFSPKSGDSTAEKSEKKIRNELIRLVYVAMTRARQRLYLSLKNPDSGKSILTSVFPVIENKFNLDCASLEKNDWEIFNYSENSFYYAKKIEEADLSGDSISINPELKTGNENQAIENTLYNGIRKQPPYFVFTSPTNLMKSGKKAHHEYSYDSHRDQPLANEEISTAPDTSLEVLNDPVNRGIITHSLLELIDLKNPVITENLFKAICFNFSVDTDESGKIADYLQQIIDVYKTSELYSLALKAVYIGKEIPYSDMLDDFNQHRSIVVGYIDLLMTFTDSIYVIDYKTNKKPERIEIENFSDYLKELYLTPMSLYKKAVSVEFPDLPVKTALYHTDSGRLFAYDNNECDECLKNMGLS